MSTAASKVLVRCADYNGDKDVLFMMKADEFRLTDPRFSANYTVLDAAPVYTHKTRTLSSSLGVFRVFTDWSLRLLPDSHGSAE